MLNRFGWALSGALALVAVLALAHATVAGPLDPPGPVGSTMRTLDQLLPSWGQTLSSTGGCTSQRFQCVMASNQAVLDKETGLVWLRSPIETFTPYGAASDACGYSATGGRSGWRLPTTTEMWSLVDASADSLPDGHPFQNVSGGPYWTTTVNREDDQNMQTVGMFGGFNEELAKSRYGNDGFSVAGAWCVRGGQALADDAAPAEQPAWSRALSAEGGCDSARFECVMNGLAVLDRETGLVWQRTPSTVPDSWSNTLSRCDERAYGGRLGWRLPEAFELASLVDPSAPSAVKLPAGHPFDLGGGSTTFWTTSLYGGGSAREAVYFQGVNAGSVGLVYVYISTAESNRYWCVRGGAGGYPE
jgi:hypothetical protein